MPVNLFDEERLTYAAVEFDRMLMTVKQLVCTAACREPKTKSLNLLIDVWWRYKVLIANWMRNAHLVAGPVNRVCMDMRYAYGHLKAYAFDIQLGRHQSVKWVDFITSQMHRCLVPGGDCIWIRWAHSVALNIFMTTITTTMTQSKKLVGCWRFVRDRIK